MRKVNTLNKGPNLVNVSSISPFTVEFDELFNEVLKILQMHKSNNNSNFLLGGSGYSKIEEVENKPNEKQDEELFAITIEQLFFLFGSANNQIQIRRLKSGKYQRNGCVDCAGCYTRDR